MHALSHESAAEAWGLPLLDPRPGVRVTSPAGRGPAGAVVVRSRFREGDLDRRDGLLVTSPGRTVADLARDLPPAEAVAVADAALNLGLVTPAELLRRGGEARGPGSARVRRACERADVGAMSPFESVVRVALLEARLAPVLTQFRLTPQGHPYDLAVPWARVLVECDSWEHHHERTPFLADRRHGNAAATAGWALVRLVWSDAWPRPDRAVALVRAAVLTGQGRRVRVRRHRARAKGAG